MTGNAPQPGETPRTESNPGSFDPDGAWWRGDGDREQAEALAEVAGRPASRRSTSGPSPDAPDVAGPILGETLDAHAAGARDAAAELEPPDPPVPGPDDVMVLPEPQHNRPTVPLDRRPATSDPAKLDVKLSRIEESPFWLTDEERAAATNPAPGAPAPAPADRAADRAGGRTRRSGRSPRRAAPGLLGLVALALIATFFSWVSAEPFWLAVGHGDRGTATVARCVGSGVTQRCVGSFGAAGGAYAVPKVTLLGVDPADRAPGSTAAARMVDRHSRQAYVGNTGLLVHLRWVLGFVLVLLCGAGIAGLTGTRQLETVRARRAALLMSLTGPLILLTGFLAAAY